MNEVMKLEQLKLMANQKPFRPFILETTGGNYIEVDKEGHVLFPPPDHELIVIFAADQLAHHVTLETINSFAVK
jgi:hypothetical protein